MEANKDIAIFMDRLDMVVKDLDSCHSKFYFNATYEVGGIK